MTQPPIPLDNLISHVQSLNPDGGPLDNLSDAVRVSAQLEAQGDALLGYFVDQARRSGASWSQIGASMGVTKQAAQKRFVDETGSQVRGAMFSRFTDRARRAVAMAFRVATAAGEDWVGPAHLAVGTLEPGGLAAKVVHDAGITDEQVYAALGLQPAEPAGAITAAELRDLVSELVRDLGVSREFKAMLRAARDTALRLGHNYIGTEHLLIAVVSVDGPAGEALRSLGVTPEATERAVTEALAQYRAEHLAG